MDPDAIVRLIATSEELESPFEQAKAFAEFRFNAGDPWMLLAAALWTVYSVLLRGRPAEYLGT